MDELIKTTTNERSEIIVSGRELHTFLEISTKYMDWMKRMIEYGFSESVDFSVFLKNEHDVTAFGGYRKITDHAITLDMAKEISMIQRNEKGKQARQYFLHLERMWNSPEMVIKRAMDFQQEKILQLETQIQEDKPYTQFGKVVSMSDGGINIGAFSKLLYDKHGITLGRNKLMEWLREKGFLIRQMGAERNLPKQRYIERGWFKVRPSIIARADGEIQSNTTLITGKGQVELANILLKEFNGGEEGTL